jgi:hypothetical protein
MTKTGFIRFIVIMCFSVSAAYGQKVKYKDLFGLLSSKQYEQAEPFLKRYLKDNDDNPNAFLYMGIIFQEKANKNDLLKQTNFALANMDSAIIFYDKAYKTITEKEVKRNDEYYQVYNRRDLRTGEFGVKLSDIQFDLEKKKEGLRERIDKIKMVKYYFDLADSLYRKSTVLFRSIQDAYPGEKEFYLRSDENTIKNLATLSARFDSCTKAFDNYKSSVTLLGKIGYNQTLTLNDITDFKKQGTSLVDFYQEDLQGWNYKKFADNAKNIIEKEIIPMRDNLVTYDIEINKLREKLNQDSISVKSDLTRLIDQLLFTQLKKFDNDPLPMNIFNLKIADLEYRSSLLEDKPLRDSADVRLQLNIVDKEIEQLNKLSELAEKLMAKDLEQDIQNYAYFITNTYSNSIVLSSYIKAIKEFTEREKRKKSDALAIRKESMNWLLNAQDSIPLVSGKDRSKFKPLSVVEDKFTTGLMYSDSLSATGYFYNITPSHIPSIKVNFPVDKPSFKMARLPYIKTLIYSDAGGQIYFVLFYSERATRENKYPATLAKIYQSDGLAWHFNYNLAFVPKELSFRTDTSELVVKGETSQNVIDKNGKLLK